MIAIELDALKLRRAVSSSTPSIIMHSNMLSVPFMHVIDSRDVQTFVAPIRASPRARRSRRCILTD